MVNNIKNMNDNSSKDLPKSNTPYWLASTEYKSFDKLIEDIDVDVVVVGGGMTGITTAFLLSKEGQKVAIIEADKILHGTTAHTTAKVTAQHDLIYDELIQHMGKEKAQLYYNANTEALNFIHKMIKDKEIECDFSEQDAYIFTNSEQYVSKLQTEFEAYQTLGINGDLLEKLPIENLPVKAALVMKNQAQFHPLKYLYHLTDDYIQHGGVIYENTVAVDIEEGDRPTVITREGNKIKANYIVIASHFPFYGIRGLYFSRMYADRAYVLGVKTSTEYTEGMYISAENPTRSLRYTENNGEKLVLVIGESHKTGQSNNEMKHYNALQDFGEKVFGINEVNYRWSTQDLTTLDKVPYVGYLTANQNNILVATGYRKWGMTNSTAAALLMTDLILKRENPYQELYSPSRFYMDPSLRKFISINMDVAKHLISGKLESPEKSPEDLDKGEGGIVSINGKRAGAYRDNHGKLHIVDTTCTHLGCELNWNSGEQTWDCPCHGSRFSYTGEVVEGPAEKALNQITEDH